MLGSGGSRVLASTQGKKPAHGTAAQLANEGLSVAQKARQLTRCSFIALLGVPSLLPRYSWPGSCSAHGRYRKAKEKGEIDEEEQQRQHARQSLERYMHYWQRWAENDKARKNVGARSLGISPGC